MLKRIEFLHQFFQKEIGFWQVLFGGWGAICNKEASKRTTDVYLAPSLSSKRVEFKRGGFLYSAEPTDWKAVECGYNNSKFFSIKVFFTWCDKL